jgi:hypothetical protein
MARRHKSAVKACHEVDQENRRKYCPESGVAHSAQVFTFPAVYSFTIGRRLSTLDTSNFLNPLGIGLLKSRYCGMGPRSATGQLIRIKSQRPSPSGINIWVLAYGETPDRRCNCYGAIEAQWSNGGPKFGCESIEHIFINFTRVIAEHRFIAIVATVRALALSGICIACAINCM